MKAYAVAATTRSPTAPDIPTVDEAGYPGLYIDIWYGPSRRARRRRSRPSSMPRSVDALADPKVRRQLSGLGQVIPPRDQPTPEALAASQKRRDRQAVADRQGGQHKDRVTIVANRAGVDRADRPRGLEPAGRIFAHRHGAKTARRSRVRRERVLIGSVPCGRMIMRCLS